jgi:hypothetical protein
MLNPIPLTKRINTDKVSLLVFTIPVLPAVKGGLVLGKSGNSVNRASDIPPEKV